MGKSNFRPTKRSDGAVLATSAENMAAFDALPRALQHELRYSVLDIGCTHLLEAIEWDDDEDAAVTDILSDIRASEGRMGRARPINPVRPVKPSIQDRRATRLARRRAKMLGISRRRT